MLASFPEVLEVQTSVDQAFVAAGADNKLTGNWESHLKQQLKSLIKSGKLVKPAGKNTYKLGEALKKAPKKKAVSILNSSAIVDLLFDLSPSCPMLCPSLRSTLLTFHSLFAGPKEGNSHKGQACSQEDCHQEGSCKAQGRDHHCCFSRW